MPIREVNPLELWQSELLLGRDEIIHGFTGRKGGVSEGPYASLSMSPRRGDDPDKVHKNEEILCLALGLNHKNLSSTCQEHTDTVAVIDELNVGIGVSSPWDHGVDAVITRLPNVPIMAYAADCVPLLFYAPDIKAIAAVHSGWRGTEMKIAEKTALKLAEMGAAVENIIVAIGPAIGLCCYEVSEDVALRFPEGCRNAKGGGKYMLDLKKSNELMLREIGITQIDNTAPCTRCHSETFFSHRGQGGVSGTLAAIIERRESR